MKKSQMVEVHLFIVLILVAFSLSYASSALAAMNEQSMLTMAVVRGDIKQIESILSAVGAKPIPKGPVILAIQRGKTEAVKAFLEHGANANDHEVLMLAVRKGNPEVVRMLLDHGANVNFKVHETIINKDRSRVEKDVSPLDVATESGNNAVRKLLLQHGAKG
ncbi:MAG: ankyrin repeat domain-containing protein [Desulfomonilaceae bacterium]